MYTQQTGTRTVSLLKFLLLLAERLIFRPLLFFVTLWLSRLALLFLGGAKGAAAGLGAGLGAAIVTNGGFGREDVWPVIGSTVGGGLAGLICPTAGPFVDGFIGGGIGQVIANGPPKA